MLFKKTEESCCNLEKNTFIILNGIRERTVINVTLKVFQSAELADQRFFEQFYTEYRKLLYYFSSHFVASSDDREDLVHDTLVRLMDYVPSLRRLYPNSNKVANYIFQTMQSVYVDYLRKNQPEKEIVFSSDELELLGEINIMEPAILTGISAKWDAMLLKEKLKDKEWLLLSGKYMIGYTDEELGQLCNCSTDSVRMALSRARKKAKTILNRNGRMGGDSSEQ